MTTTMKRIFNHKLLSLLLCMLLACLLFTALAPQAHAEIASGTVGGDDVNWVIDDEGNLTISPVNGESGKMNINGSFPWSSYSSSIKTVVFEPGITISGRIERMFYKMTNLTSINFGDLRSTNITMSLDSMFEGCSKLTSLDLTWLDTSRVSRFYSLFSGCSSLSSVNMSGWNTGAVIDMSWMFQNCRSLTSLDLSHFNTASVTNMSGMFSGCSGLTSLNLSKWDTGKVEYMAHMFQGCSGLTSLDLSHFNTASVTNMSSMFSGCSGLTSLDLSHFNTASVTNMGNMFQGCSGLTSLDLSGWNTASATNMRYMFADCSGLTSLNMSGWNTGAVNYMYYMFKNCSGLTSLDLSGWNTGSVTDMSNMFQGCSGLTSLDLSNFDTANVTSMKSMFNGCSSLKSLDLSNFDTTKVKFMPYMFSGCSSLAILDLSSFNTGAITNASNLRDFLSGTTGLQAVALGSNTISNKDRWQNARDGGGWVKYAELSGKRVYDGEEIEHLRNATDYPGWYKLKNAPIPQNIELYSEFTSEEDEQTEFWVKEGNTWSYTFNVYDDTIPYWIWEDPVDGFNSEQTTPFKIEPDPDTGKIPAVVSILNTKPQETGSITIKKVVPGSVDNSFRFDITLTGDDISGTQKFGGVTFVNGSGYVFLANGESVTLDGIPVGTSFSITEQQEAGYTPSWDKTPSGKIEQKDQNFSFTCTNTLPPPPPPPPPGSADLHITKAVTGHYNHADDISFTFTVVFKGMVANKTYNYTAAGESLSFTTDASGTAYVTFILADGESADFLNLPVGSTYQISEDGGDWAASYVVTDANGGSKIVSSSGSATSGNPLNTAVETADSGEDVTVAYTNVLEKMQDIFIKKTVTGSAADKDMSFTLTVVFEGLTPGAYYNSDIGTIRADVDGRAERQFGMKDGDVFWFYGLPVGTSYVFTEEANPYIASFTVTDSAGGTAIVTPSGQNDKSRTDLSTGVELVDEDEKIGVTFTNRSVPLRDIPVKKIWDDANDQDGKRPKSVEVQLLANGVALGDPVTLTRTKDWSYTWTDLDVYDDSNKEIEYSVKETKIEYYDEPVYGGDMTNGFTITNPYKPEETEVPVTKIWDDDDDRDGKRPESITVSLLADGKKIDETTLTAANKWTATFTGLDKYRDHGVEIVYTVKEVSVKGYSSKMSGDATTGYTITNSHTPETVEIEIPVRKTITKTNAPRGEVTFKFELTGSDPLPDTTELEISLEGSQKGSADDSFGSVKFEKPGTYTYTISETELPKGWSADGAKSGTVTITVTDNGKGALEATIDPEIVEIKNQYQHRDNVPKTDDNTNLDKWGIGAAISLAGFAGVELIDAIVKKRKKEDEAK